MFNLKNPALLLIITWLFVLIVYSLRASLILTELNFKTINYIFLVCSSLFFSTVFFKSIFTSRNFKAFNYNLSASNHIPWSNINFIWKIWVLMTTFEIIYFKGLPFLSVIGITSGIDRYTEWGIPSLHGLLNAIILTISNFVFLNYLQTQNRKYLHLFLICLLWPVLLLTRQLLMSMLLQAILIFVYYRGIKFKSFFKILGFIFLITLVFGIIGDIRTGESFLDVAQPADNFPKWLPSGFLWVYIYIVSPLNNINFNIDNFSLFDLNLYPITSGLLPSFIRDNIITNTSQLKFYLVNDNLNVSTFFLTYLTSFGLIGSIIFFFMMGFFLNYIFAKYNTSHKPIKWLFVIVVLTHNVLFSIFVDFFFNLVFIFQITVHLLIWYKIKPV